MAVTVVTVLAVVAAVASFVHGVLTLRDAGGSTREILDGIQLLALGLLATVIAIGALRLAPWAWKLFMTWTVVVLTLQLLRVFWFGDPDYLRIAGSTFIVLALTPRDVQVAFGIRLPPNAELTRTTRNPIDRD